MFRLHRRHQGGCRGEKSPQYVPEKQNHPSVQALMKNTFSRRNFVFSGALAGAGLVASGDFFALAKYRLAPEEPSRFRLGLASYTFRNFSRVQMIGFTKQLKAFELNVKDVKDHLPTDPQEEAAALADYAAAGVRLHAAGTIYFTKDEDADIRNKFEYCKRAGIAVIVAGDPALETLPRIEKFVKEYDIRIAIHNHGPEDKLWHSPLDVLNAVKSMDPRIGCCIDVGHTVRAGADVVRAIREAGPRLFNVHMKDLANFQSKDSQVAVGDGIMPVRKIFEALFAMGYKGFVDLEYEIHPDDPMPGVIGSFAYMRGILAGLGT
jgi:sugar phosphate isomerase/epimerase